MGKDEAGVEFWWSEDREGWAGEKGYDTSLQPCSPSPPDLLRSYRLFECPPLRIVVYTGTFMHFFLSSIYFPPPSLPPSLPLSLLVDPIYPPHASMRSGARNGNGPEEGRQGLGRRTNPPSLPPSLPLLFLPAGPLPPSHASTRNWGW